MFVLALGGEEGGGKGGSDNSRASLSNLTGCFLAESHALEEAFRLVEVGDLEWS
jgi:hypothetical protein